jgi:Protein of unknown function (DUF402)
VTVWSPGDVVAVREVWRGRIWKARPWIVVYDRPDELALFIPHGTPTKIPPGSGIPRRDWVLEDGIFGHDALRLVRPGEAHSVLLFWRNGEFHGWYVNLERPLTRSRVGFNYLDQELDIYVRPDRTWTYLDEDEFSESQLLGVIGPEEARAVREEAARLIEAIEAWRPPFSAGWETWRPDPAWTLPQLPSGWETVP